MSQPQSISLERLKTVLSTGNKSLKLIDIRSASEYQKQHIPVAQNIPAEMLDGAEFSQDDIFVCICNHGQQRSQDAAMLLLKKGFENVFYLEGGTSIWFDENSNR